MTNQENIEPPKWALRLLRWYCKPRVLEIIEGDIYELFEKRIRSENPGSARRMFVWDVLRFFRLRYIKGINDLNSINNIAMFKNYFKTSLRSLYRQRLYSLINISGLSIALAACLLIALYISNELSYDKFHKDADRIYKFSTEKDARSPWTPVLLGHQSEIDFPEIEETMRLSGPWTSTFQIGNLTFKESGGFGADSTFHKIFSIKFLEGNSEKALTEPNSVILTKSLAQKYFNDQPAFGQLVKLDGVTTKVTGVVPDPPKNTHFYYKFIQSYPHATWLTNGPWVLNEVYTYAKLAPEVSVEELEAKYPEFMRRHAGNEILKYSNYDSYDDLLANSENPPTFFMKPITDLHLYYPALALGSSGDINNVYIFSVVAVFILLIAGINFMNLSTARSASRLKEVGMRKVMGSIRKQLVSQFLVESILISTFAMILAIGLGTVLLEGFNNLANREFGLSDLFATTILFKLVGLTLIIGFLAGCYPALYLSGFKPIKALKGEIRISSGSVLFRKGLVAFQFAISILLIISTTVVFEQLDFIKKQDLGFEPDQVLLVKNGYRLSGNLELFEDAAKRNPNVQDIAYSHKFLSGQIPGWGFKTVEDNPRNGNSGYFYVSTDFLNTVGFELNEGRFFSEELSAEGEEQNIVINETAAKWLGYEEVLGKKLSGGEKTYTIIGVVKDFHFATAKRAIGPMVLRYMPNTGIIRNNQWGARYISIKVTGNYQNVVADIEQAWTRLVPDEPFDFVFLNDSFNRLYEEDRRFGRLFTVSSTLAIAIACLGLFALAAFTLERRNKEMAIRKVLGASAYGLTVSFIKSFTVLVAIGSLVAIPLGYFMMNDWLDTFAYQTKIGVFTLAIPVLLATIIAWFTVGYQSVQAALTNPVKALRSE